MERYLRITVAQHMLYPFTNSLWVSENICILLDQPLDGRCPTRSNCWTPMIGDAIYSLSWIRVRILVVIKKKIRKDVLNCRKHRPFQFSVTQLEILQWKWLVFGSSWAGSMGKEYQPKHVKEGYKQLPNAPKYGLGCQHCGVCWSLYQIEWCVSQRQSMS